MGGCFDLWFLFFFVCSLFGLLFGFTWLVNVVSFAVGFVVNGFICLLWKFGLFYLMSFV